MADDRRPGRRPFYNADMTYEEIKEIRLGLCKPFDFEAYIAKLKRELAAGREPKPKPADDEPPVV